MKGIFMINKKNILACTMLIISINILTAQITEIPQKNNHGFLIGTLACITTGATAAIATYLITSNHDQKKFDTVKKDLASSQNELENIQKQLKAKNDELEAVKKQKPSAEKDGSAIASVLSDTIKQLTEEKTKLEEQQKAQQTRITNLMQELQAKQIQTPPNANHSKNPKIQALQNAASLAQNENINTISKDKLNEIMQILKGIQAAESENLVSGIIKTDSDLDEYARCLLLINNCLGGETIEQTTMKTILAKEQEKITTTLINTHAEVSKEAVLNELINQTSGLKNSKTQ
jgi:hypothetical protein